MVEDLLHGDGRLDGPEVYERVSGHTAPWVLGSGTHWLTTVSRFQGASYRQEQRAGGGEICRDWQYTLLFLFKQRGFNVWTGGLPSMSQHIRSPLQRIDICEEK